MSGVSGLWTSVLHLTFRPSPIAQRKGPEKTRSRLACVDLPSLLAARIFRRAKRLELDLCSLHGTLRGSPLARHQRYGEMAACAERTLRRNAQKSETSC